MDEKIQFIKEWLGTGSINIFGLPFSGKDTVGVRLAEDLGGRFLSSGMILRAAAEVDMELKRDLAKGLPINMPRHYYPGDNPDATPVVNWRAHAHLFFSNWLNYYVYQETPYEFTEE